MYKPLADSTLLHMTKKELIELLRTAEHNAEVSQEWVAQQAENLKDWEPVVHCRDCKHFNHEHMECENEAVSTDHEGGAQYSLNFELDDFCSYGERKDGGEDND